MIIIYLGLQIALAIEKLGSFLFQEGFADTEEIVFDEAVADVYWLFYWLASVFVD